ncbi:MAG: hypothetical protein ACI8PB_001023 [Desulforhopalus sp.]|jgi:hypothetical protein
MEAIKVHVSQDNYISFSCPCCEKTYQVSVAKFKNTKHKLGTRCNCAKRFEIDLNFRRFYRKGVEIFGEFTNLSSGSGKWFAMTVIDLSMSGLRFKTVGLTGIKKDNRLRVKFTIDSNRTDLEKEVVVRNVGTRQYGCEFINLSYEEKELGFYLFPK